MKILLSLLLLASSPAAAQMGGLGIIVDNSSAGGGSSASSSTGTHTDGGNASFNRVVTNQLTSTGTAPSLTATGIVAAAGSSITATGNATVSGTLGVGTASPAAKLQVVRSDGAQAMFSGYNQEGVGEDSGQVDIGDYTNGVGARMDYNGTTTGHWRFLNAYAPGGFLFGRGVTAASGGQNFQVGTSSMVLIGSSGNLGIGTASPLAKLSVNGNSSFASPATFLSSVTVGGASENYLGVGDDTQYATNAQSGFKVTDYLDGNLYFDNKTVSGGTIYYRSGAGAESGSSRTWLTVNPATAKVSAAGGAFSLYSRTIAQLLAITPAIGDKYLCSNCSVPGSVAIGTAAVQGAFGIIAPGAFQ